MKSKLNAVFFTLIFLTGTASYAKGSAVAPLPNLMPVIMQHGKLLDLNKSQQAELAKWRKGHHQAMHGLSAEIQADQDAILKAALSGKPADEILAMEKAVEEKRVKFMTTKTACRDNMKKVLTAGQWEQVVKIYKGENGLK